MSGEAAFCGLFSAEEGMGERVVQEPREIKTASAAPHSREWTWTAFFPRKQREERNFTRRQDLFLFPSGFALLIFGAAFSVFFKQLSLNCLLFPVEDGGGFFIVFPFFKFPDDAFFFHHPFEPFDGFFQHLAVVNDNMRQKISPPFPKGQNKNHPAEVPRGRRL
jgi:hypothetical protein